MGLELDRLENNDTALVIYNNTTGALIGFGYTLKDFKEALFKEWQIRNDQIKDYFSKDELEEFFNDNNLEFEEKELNELF